LGIFVIGNNTISYVFTYLSDGGSSHDCSMLEVGWQFGVVVTAGTSFVATTKLLYTSNPVRSE